jgi:hypothetical protein
MAAAAVSAAALGFVVFWSYEPDAVPPGTVASPVPAQAPRQAPPAQPSISAPAASSPSEVSATLPARGRDAEAIASISVPAKPSAGDVTPAPRAPEPPHQTTALERKDTPRAGANGIDEKSRASTQGAKPAPSANPTQAAPRVAPDATAETALVPSPEKPVDAVPPAAAVHANAGSPRVLAVGPQAPAAADAPPPPAVLLPPHAASARAATPAPSERAQVSAPARMVDIPSPQPERPAAAIAQPDRAVIAAEPPRTPVVALAPPAEQPPPVPAARPAAPAPQAVAPRAAPAKPRRVAAIPPAAAVPARPEAPEAKPVTVMRGGPRVRTAQSGKPQATVRPAPAITVIRGSRVHPALLARNPGPLILRVPN